MFKGNYEKPTATAKLRGSKEYESINGKADFYETYGGTVVVAEVTGIPAGMETDGKGFFGFHIHEGKRCTGNAADPFADTGGHYNPGNVAHPGHPGDLPPLLSNKGTAWMAVYTSRFFPEEVVGRTVVIHGMPDDFRTQPSGDSGMKIACGEIILWNDR